MATRNLGKEQKENQTLQDMLSNSRCEPIQEIVAAEIQEITGKKWQN